MRRSLVLANSLIRLAYGVGAVISPAAMTRAGLAPDVEKRPEARLFVRGFGAHQVGVAALGVASIWLPALERPAMKLALAIDVLDMVSALAEAAEREEAGADVTGGLVFSAAGAASAGAALFMDADAG